MTVATPGKSRPVTCNEGGHPQLAFGTALMECSEVGFLLQRYEDPGQNATATAVVLG